MAAGNENAGISSWPYASPMLVVAATGTSDTKTSWSNYGSTVALAAPGGLIYTTKNGGGYGAGMGTSFSAPVVAGVPALVYSVR